MKRRLLSLALLPVLTAVAALVTRAQAAPQAIDAVSGSSIAVSSTSVTESSAKISFSESQIDGSLRIYCSTTSFASAADTSKAGVTKLSVTSRGNGNATLTGLTAATTYYYRFQGYFEGKAPSAYSATGSFKTSAASTGIRTIVHPGRSSIATTNVLGRPAGHASAIKLSSEGATPSLQGNSH